MLLHQRPSILLLLTLLPSVFSSTIAWTNPSTSSPSLLLAPLSTILFNTPSCESVDVTLRSRERDLVLPPQTEAIGVLVLSVLNMPREEMEEAREGRNTEEIGEGEAELVEALLRMRKCGGEIKVVELEDLKDVLDEDSNLSTDIFPSYSYTLLTTLSPSSLLLLSPPSASTFSPTSWTTRKARLSSLLRETTTGPLAMLIASTWVCGLLFIARRVWTNRKAAMEDRKELEWEGEEALMSEEGGEMKEVLFDVVFV
ncbi:hypothetical protein P7C70_g9161, partial [Phenoliferia sp. Uapishka_3]